MAWVWTGSADFSGSVVGTSGGTGFILSDILTIPSGLVPALAFLQDNQAFLVVAWSFTSAPGVAALGQAINGLTYFVDGNGSTQNAFGGSSLGDVGFEGTSSPTRPYRVVNSSWASDADTTSGLALGGSLQIQGTCSIPDTETITGTVVAAIWDGTAVIPGAVSSIQPNNDVVLPPNSGNFAPDPGVAGWNAYAAMMTVAGVADSSPASAPDFSGAANWSTLVSRTTLARYAAIGEYTGALDASSHPYALGIPSGVDLATVISALQLNPSGRSFGMIIDD